MDQCDSDEKLGYVKKYNLPTGIKIVLDGFAAKTVKWGLNTINTGPSPTTWFRGEVKGKIIWVTSHEMMWMFQSESNFRSVNLSTFETLKFQQRRPQLSNIILMEVQNMILG